MSSDETSAALQQAAVALRKARERIAELESRQRESVAIIGMACRFPKASNPGEYWNRLLLEGADAVEDVQVRRPSLAGVNGGGQRWAALLEEVTDFDAQFFHISPREAVTLDPQQRLLLELTWEGLEDAGLVPSTLWGRSVSVFVGLSTHDYGLRFKDAMASPAGGAEYGMYVMSGNTASFAAGRISYVFGFEGPSVAIDTGCSSSLVGLHLAAQSLRTREADLAIAGGANVILNPNAANCLATTGAMSRDGRCRAFDAGANGFVRGEGAGVVVLKRLSDALRDGDPIWAVIKGSAVNSDGRSSGLTAPNVAAQTKCLRLALAAAGVPPDSIAYVETHGTGTVLGDPIEFAALDEVYGRSRRPSNRCWLGAVKTNIGHLEAAAGVAGLIKTVLAVHHGKVPPNLNFSIPNPRLGIEATPFAVPRQIEAWPAVSAAGERGRLAAVSSFGLSGTNAHVIVEQAPPPEAATAAASRTHSLLVLSACEQKAVREACARYAEFIEQHEAHAIEDVCCTANRTRQAFRHRLAIVAGSRTELIAKLRAAATDASVCVAAARSTPRKLAMLFAGQGAQYRGMGQALYSTRGSFREAFDECDRLATPLLGRSIASVLYSGDGDPERSLDETRWSQPALFAVEYALARLWLEQGLEPSVVIGHSLGEYVAACLAGVFSLESAIRLLVVRGELMQNRCEPGSMLAIHGSRSEVSSLVERSGLAVSLAAINGERDFVYSGAPGEIALLEAGLTAARLRHRRLSGSRAFHSNLVEPILEAFRAALGREPLAPPKIPMIGNLTGQLMGNELATPDYWVRQARETVLFAASVRQALALGVDAFLEVSPHPTLLGLIDGQGDVVHLPSLKRGQPDWAMIQASLGRWYETGSEVDWRAWSSGYQSRHVRLPTYPFQRKRYWVEDASASSAVELAEGALVGANAARAPGDEAVTDPYLEQEPRARRAERAPLHELAWEARPATAARPVMGDWLVIGGPPAVRERLAFAARAAGVECIGANTRFEDGPEGGSAMLVAALDRARVAGRRVVDVVDLRALDWPAASADPSELMPCLEGALRPCLALFRTLAQDGGRDASPRLWVVTKHEDGIPGDARHSMAAAAVGALCRVFLTEYPDVACSHVELDANDPDAWAPALLDELRSGSEPRVLYRAGQRCVARLRALDASETPRVPTIRADATYLVTGAFGALGFLAVRELLQRGARQFVLVGRQAPTTQQTAELAELGKHGATFRIESCDVGDASAVSQLFAALRHQDSPVRGIVHAAGAVLDVPLSSLTWDDCVDVLRGKAQGAWNLHLAAGPALDFFWMFSSAASVFGPPAQGSYAAANAILASIARYRSSQQLSALAIDWGPWRIGMAARVGASGWNAPGVRPLEPELAWDCLDRAIESGRTQVVAIDLSWKEFMAAAESVPPLLEGWAHLVPPVRSFAEEFQRALLQHGAAQTRPLIEEFLIQQLARILGSRPADLDTALSLPELGVDSLMGLELRNKMRRALHLHLPSTIAWMFPTLAELARHVADEWIDGQLREALTAAPSLEQGLEEELVL